MAVFAYQGTGDRGERRAGELEASSRAEALRRLAMDRIQPLTLVAKADEALANKPVRSQALASEKPRRETISGNIRLSNAQVILFTDELADFLHSGLQLEPALQLIEPTPSGPISNSDTVPANSSPAPDVSNGQMPKYPPFG